MKTKTSFWQRMGFHEWFLKREAGVSTQHVPPLTPDNIYKYIVQEANNNFLPRQDQILLSMATWTDQCGYNHICVNDYFLHFLQHLISASISFKVSSDKPVSFAISLHFSCIFNIYFFFEFIKRNMGLLSKPNFL